MTGPTGGDLLHVVRARARFLIVNVAITPPAYLVMPPFLSAERKPNPLAVDRLSSRSPYRPPPGAT